MQVRPKHMLQGRLHLAQMRPREGRLKITNREGMAERQGRDEMKACKQLAAIEAELYNLGWANKLY